MKRKLIAVFISAILILGLIYIFFVDEKSDKKEKESDISVVESGATVTIKNFKQVARKKGKVVGILKAEMALIFPEKQIVKLVNTELSYFDKDNNRIVVIASDGFINMTSRDVKVSGGVEVTNSEYTFKTEALDYKSSENTIRSKGEVDVSSRFSNFRADKMIIDLKDNRIEFQGNIKGYFSENY